MRVNIIIPRRLLSYTLAVPALWAISLTGCTPGGTQFSMREHLPSWAQGGTTASPTPTAAQRETRPASHNSTASFVDASREAGQRATESIRTAYHKASDAVSDALTIEPRIDAPDDPTSLRSPVGPLSADLYVEAARLADQQGNFAAATEQYQKALHADPNNRRALIGFARMNERQGDVEQALALYQRAIKAHPNDPLPYNDLGLCYALHGRTSEGLTALTRAVELDPQNKRFRNNLAIVLVDAERYDEALAHLQTVHSPGEAHHNLACLLSAHGKEALASQHYAMAQRFTSSASTATSPAAAMVQAPSVAPAASQPVQVSPVILSPNSGWQGYSPESTERETSPSVRTATLERESAAVARTTDFRQVGFDYDSRRPGENLAGDQTDNFDGSFFQAGSGAQGTPVHLPPVN